MWIPEPKYRFYNFKPQDKKVINASMVALLIKLYDCKEKRGLTEVRLDGGDFMIEKGFENYDINFENVFYMLLKIYINAKVNYEFFVKFVLFACILKINIIYYSKIKNEQTL